ncbi:MAG: tetratricopeptide repeat protein [Methyloglobulus sp.]|nr:tetratricopeptide repeat protein [Methyloglobulus sp.]
MIIATLVSSITAAKAESASTVLQQAYRLYAERKFAQALPEFQHAVELDRGSITAWRGLGWTYWSLGNHEQAYQIWTDLIKAFPEDLQTLLALGEAYEQAQHWQESVSYYTQVLRLDAHQLTALKGRTRVFIAQGKYQQAEQDLRTAIKQSPTDSDLKTRLADVLDNQHRFLEAESILRNLNRIKLAPANLKRLGKVLTEQGKYEQAADAYKTSLSMLHDSQALSDWRAVGTRLREVGQSQRAYLLWQELLRSYPNDLTTLIALAHASEQDQLWQQGLDYYARVLQKSSVNHAAHLGRARIFSVSKDYKSAESEIRSILTKSPADTEARFALLETLVVMHRNQEAQGILLLLTDQNYSPKNLNRLGAALNSLGKEEEAAKYFKKSLQIAPNDADAIQGLAQSYIYDNRYSEAEKLLQNYLAKHPENDMVRAKLAEQASSAGKWAQAEREFRILADKHPEEIKWRVKRALLLHRAGQHEAAIKMANEVIGKSPLEPTMLGLIADDASFSGDIKTAIRWATKLAAVDPTADRLIRLGKLHMLLGDQLSKEDKHGAALVEYRSAAGAIEQAGNLDPVKTGAPIEMIDALRLQGRQREAMELGQEVLAKYPSSADVIKQVATCYKEQGDYMSAHQILARNTPYFTDSSALTQSLAELAYYAGEKDEAFEMLNKDLDSSRQAIPVLVYRGISKSSRQDAVPLQNFHNQLLALKQQGYHAITLAQLLGFFEGTEQLPVKPFIITFDGARSDSFEFADPVLLETGFKATMFVPVAEVATHQPYTAVWPAIRQKFNSGRWDIQCQGTQAQHYIPVNVKGHLGHFLANKMWLADSARLETNKEFSARIERDMLTCKETLAQEVSGSKVFAFAFPFGDQGHKSLSNVPEAFNINQRLVKQHFGLGFNLDNSYLLTANSPRFTLPRFEVLRTYTGSDLAHQLKSIQPASSTAYKLVHLNMASGRYQQALKIVDGIAKEDVADNADLLVSSGKMLNWSGDPAGARTRFEQALTLGPHSPAIEKELAVLDRRLKPSLLLGGLYFQDNAHRSYYSFSPSFQFPVSDRLSLSAYYKYLDFSQTLKSGVLATALGEQDYQATGHQFEGQFNYKLGSRTNLALSAGFADFSGHSPQNASTSSTFPLGSIKFNAGIGDDFDVSFAADHTNVNTAGAIVNGIAFTRVAGGFTAKVLEAFSVSANHAYFYYTDKNQRNRTEVNVSRGVWTDPDIAVGLQFVRDDTMNNNPLFWTPDNYIGISAPFSLKKKWGDSVVAEVSVAPGIGKEAGHDFKFQINSTGSINWDLNDDFSVYVSASRYQASSYSSFSTFAGILVRF